MSFQSELVAISGVPGIHSCYQFLGAVLSPWTSAEQAKEIIQASAVDWEQVFGLAAGNLVSPLLWERINEKNLTGLIPKDFLMALQVIHEANCERNRQHQVLLLEATQALNQIGIEPILLKGAHSLVGLGPDEESRILSDVDLIIPNGRTREAQGFLISKGYYEQQLYEGEWHEASEESSHQLSPLFHPTLPAYLELHHYPHWQERSEGLIDYILSELQLLEIEGCRMWFMPLKARFLYNQFHHYYSDMERNAEVDFRFLSEQAAFACELGTSGIEELRALVAARFPEFEQGMQVQLDLMPILFGLQGIESHSLKSEIELYLRYLVGNLDHQKYRQRQVLISALVHVGWLLRNPGKLFQRLTSPGWYLKAPKTLLSYYRRGHVIKPEYKK